MGALTGLFFGIGLYLIVVPPAPRLRRPRSFRPVQHLERLIVRAGFDNTRPVQILAAAVLLFTAVCALITLVTSVLAIGIATGVLAAFGPVALLNARALRRQLEFAQAWPDAVDHLASAIRAGLSLPEALIGLGERGPLELREPFKQFAKDYQSTGRFALSLDRLKDRLADPVGDRVVEALRIAREVGGGDLGRMLRSLSGFLREELRTRSELEARQSWTISGARLAAAAPWLVLLMMSFQRDVIGRFAEPAGIILLSIGAAVCLVAYRLMMRLGRLPVERRVLA